MMVVVALSVSACAANGVTPPAPQPFVTALPTYTLSPLLTSATATPPAVFATPLPTTVAATLPPNRATSVVPTDTPPSPTPVVSGRLVIPKLDLDENIIPVLIVDGTWDLTKLEKEVGWLATTGQQPGGDLAMTLAGHVNLSLGNPGPFVDLKRLKEFDQVIYRSGGLDYIYAVEGQETVKPDEVDALYVPNGERLLLVTCSDWSYFWRNYARRLIVTAALVRTEPSPE